MKIRILLFNVMIGMFLGAFAQKPAITLTFTADNNGLHVPINSILIENLTQGGDTTLFAPDTALAIDYTSDIDEINATNNNVFSVSQNYPNPIKGKTMVSINLHKRGNVQITISDVVGRELINNEYNLEQGSHSFSFYPGRENLYFFTVKTDHQSQSIKMLNFPSYTNDLGNLRLEYNWKQIDLKEYKSENNLSHFSYNLGDKLKFTATTFLGERVITSSPTSDRKYYFRYTGDPCPGTPNVTDIDGNAYNTVQIGEQCWMVENLKTSTYNNGEPIPYIYNDNEWINDTIGAHVWYDHDAYWNDIYGSFYNWYAVVNPNGICPEGWHVPSYEEWLEMVDYIGGYSSPNGNKLKSCRQTSSPLGGGCDVFDDPKWSWTDLHFGTDDYGFAAYPAGSRYHSGIFVNKYYAAQFWTSTIQYPYSVFSWSANLYKDEGFVMIMTELKQNGYSIRCVKD
jgi:uncharacterized protein (TIGR02145 family)